MKNPIKKFKGFNLKNLPEDELFASGHRACQGCGTVLPVRWALKVLGPDTIAVSATGCMEVVSTPFPYTSWKVPWLHLAFENAASAASGVEAALKVLKRKRRFPKKKKVNIVVFAGDGATFDIGLQWLSGALERGHNFIYICLDNEAYMNTGVQRSGGTPYGAHTTTSPAGKVIKGKIQWKKDLPQIFAAHKIPYVATASVGYYLDFMNKVKKASMIEGPAYIHVFSPCPTGWGVKPELSIELGKLVVEARIFPLYEVINGRYVLNKKVDKPKPVEEYLKIQRRFRHLTEDEIKFIQERVNEEYERLLKLCEAFPYEE